MPQSYGLYEMAEKTQILVSQKNVVPLCHKIK